MRVSLNVRSLRTCATTIIVRGVTDGAATAAASVEVVDCKLGTSPQDSRFQLLYQHVVSYKDYKIGQC